jgi:hypothetical protein
MPQQLLAFTDTPLRANGNPLVDRYLQNMPMLNLYRAEELPAKAEQMAEELLRTPEGRRAMQPFYILAFEMKASEYRVDAVSIFERCELDVTRDTRALAELAWRLARRNVTLDLIFCDNENTLTPWELGQERFKAVYASDAARSRMPEELRAFDPGKLVFMSPEYHQWMMHLNRHAQKIKMSALRKALCDSGLLSPWAGRPGSPQTRAANYFCFQTSFRCFDLNGWEYDLPEPQSGLIDGRTGCPVAYPGDRGFRFKDRAHHPIWNSFIDGINHARSAAAVSDILPVIREPLRARGQAEGTVDPGGRWLSDQLIGHLVRTGARWFVYFHPAATAADDIAIAEILDHHNADVSPTTPLTNRLPEIPLDVDEVVTGSFRTTYADFLAKEPNRWAPPN